MNDFKRGSKNLSAATSGAIAAAGAIVALLVSFFVVHVPLPVAALAAIVVLVGLLVLFQPEVLLIKRQKRPPTVTEKQWMDSCLQLAQHMEEKCEELNLAPACDRQAFPQLQGMCKQVRKILGAIQEDPDKYACAEQFADRMVQLSDWLDGYVRVTKRELADIERQMAAVRTEVIPNILYSLDRIWNRLHDDDVISTSVSGKMMEFKLEPLDQGKKG